MKLNGYHRYTRQLGPAIQIVLLRARKLSDNKNAPCSLHSEYYYSNMVWKLYFNIYPQTNVELTHGTLDTDNNIIKLTQISKGFFALYQRSKSQRFRTIGALYEICCHHVSS